MQYETIKAIIIEINEKIKSDIPTYTFQQMKFVCMDVSGDSAEEYEMGPFTYEVSETHISFYDTDDVPTHYFMGLDRIKEIVLDQNNPEEEQESEEKPLVSEETSTSTEDSSTSN